MAGNIKFEELCRTLEAVFTGNKDKKMKLLSKLIEFCRQLETSANGTDPSHKETIYPVMRLLLPKLEERGPYGVKEHTLGKIFCRILCLNSNSPDANRLMKYRSPAAGSFAGDFAAVAYWVLKNRCGAGRILTVDEINKHLDNISGFHAANKPRSVDQELESMIRNMCEDELKWMMRILLKDMRLGLGHNSILNIFHPDAKDLNDVCNNLRKVCGTLHNCTKRLHEIEVSIFEPCRPMLSEKCDVLTVDTILNKAPYYYVERKHDGERFQLHMRNGAFRYFSRNGFDFTENFGQTSNSGMVTPHLAKQLNSDVISCILDGEMMGWNQRWQCFGSKGMKFDVKTLRAGNVHRPCFCVFDILHLNGEVLTNRSFEERLKILLRIFTPLEGVLMHTPRKRVTSSSEVIQALNEAIDNQEEGLILKDPFSIYKPATAKGGWFKIKPEFTDQLSDDMDLVIIGGYYGGGRHKCNVSHFLLGVAVPPKVGGSQPTEFHSFCRVGSGYTREELNELLMKLDPHWRKVKCGQLPQGLVWTKERPDLWIPPQHSKILQVKAMEIQESDQYQVGLTLRFPRVVAVRYDKELTDCCTLNNLLQLRAVNNGKLTSRHVNIQDVGNMSQRIKRQRTKPAQSLGQEYQPADVTNVSQISARLRGREFCVISGNTKISKQELEKRIVGQGGTVVQFRGSDTFCAIAGEPNVRVKNLSGEIDVASVDWLLRVLDANEVFDWSPHDLFCMSVATQEQINMKYDRFFDSFHKPVELEELKRSLQKVSEMGACVSLLPSEMAELDDDLFSGPNRFAIFRCCIAYFVIPESVDAVARECDLLRLMFRFQGGRVSDSLNSDVTHVLLHSQDIKQYSCFSNLNHSRQEKFHLVTYNWLSCCWAKRFRLAEKDFHFQSKQLRTLH